MTRIAVAGAGAVGAAVARALIQGIDGFELTAISDLHPDKARSLIGLPVDTPFVAIDEIANCADWVVEALPAAAVPALAEQVLGQGKTLVMISSAALLLYPEMRERMATSHGRVLVPSGALIGMDGLNALAEQGVESVSLTTTKHPRSLQGAPHIVKNAINLDSITSPTVIFSGNALEAAAAFPANVNVAATLTVASRLSPERVHVEVCADPAMTSNRHEVVAKGAFSTLRFSVENMPDPANPKSSALTASSIIAMLKRHYSPFVIGT